MFFASKYGFLLRECFCFKFQISNFKLYRLESEILKFEITLKPLNQIITNAAFLHCETDAN
jgi:hypothetical protein